MPRLDKDRLNLMQKPQRKHSNAFEFTKNFGSQIGYDTRYLRARLEVCTTFCTAREKAFYSLCCYWFVREGVCMNILFNLSFSNIYTQSPLLF